jgi:hypothetical protein
MTYLNINLNIQQELVRKPRNWTATVSWILNMRFQNAKIIILVRASDLDQISRKPILVLVRECCLMKSEEFQA